MDLKVILKGKPGPRLGIKLTNEQLLAKSERVKLWWVKKKERDGAIYNN